MIINLSPILKNSAIFRTNKSCLYPNFAPLKQDTVSFSGAKTLSPFSMKYAPNYISCRNVSQDAIPAEHYLNKVLHRYLDSYIAEFNTDVSHSKPILSLTTRIKSPSSIREKTISSYFQMIESESKNFTNESIDEVSKYFPMSPFTNEDSIKSTIKNVTTDSFLALRVPLFVNAKKFFPEICNSLETIGAFDFSSLPSRKKQNVYRNISERLQENHENPSVVDGAYIEPRSIGGIRHYAQDIVGARIVLGESSFLSTGLVLNAIGQASKDGLLKIKKIEAHIPDENKLLKGSSLSDYLYASDWQLRQLSKVVGAEYTTHHSKSGYMGIHLDVELNDESFSNNPKFADYSGEIQIMGRDVEILKDVEDICYKLKQDKALVHKAYKPFKDHFETYYVDSVKEHFNNYTHDLFLKQRIISSRTKLSGVFPSIKDLGYEGKVPEALDYNNLRILKLQCDYQKELIEKTKEDSHAKNEKCSLRKQDHQKEIQNAISLINHKFTQL